MRKSSDRTPAPARSGRRPVPALIVLLLLVLGTCFVWWNVVRQDAGMAQAQAAACTSAAEVPESMDPATITLRVYNATETPGLATEAAEALGARGFMVAEAGNDPHPDITVTGVGELRFGPGAGGVADFVRLYVPGMTARQDTRADKRVDVVLGPDFKDVASTETVATALTEAADAEAGC